MSGVVEPPEGKTPRRPPSCRAAGTGHLIPMHPAAGSLVLCKKCEHWLRCNRHGERRCSTSLVRWWHLGDLRRIAAKTKTKNETKTNQGADE